jgi:hypothetical protein
VLTRDKLVVIPQAYSGRRFGWLDPVIFTLIWGVSTLNLASLVDAWIDCNCMVMLPFSPFICVMHMFYSCE